MPRESLTKFPTCESQNKNEFRNTEQEQIKDKFEHCSFPSATRKINLLKNVFAHLIHSSNIDSKYLLGNLLFAKRIYQIFFFSYPKLRG